MSSLVDAALQELRLNGCEDQSFNLFDELIASEVSKPTVICNILIRQLGVLHAELHNSTKSKISLHFLTKWDVLGLVLLVFAPGSIRKKLKSLIVKFDRAAIGSTLLFQDGLAQLDELAVHENISRIESAFNDCRQGLGGGGRLCEAQTLF